MSAARSPCRGANRPWPRPAQRYLSHLQRGGRVDIRCRYAAAAAMRRLQICLAGDGPKHPGRGRLCPPLAPPPGVPQKKRGTPVCCGWG